MKKLPLLALPALLALAGTAAPAHAVVYCKYVGYPKGCVAKPGIVYAPYPGAGAPGVGVRPGVGAGAPGVGLTAAPGVGGPANRGGPVNRVGVR